jgi:hypothetical protein
MDTRLWLSAPATSDDLLDEIEVEVEGLPTT